MEVDDVWKSMKQVMDEIRVIGEKAECEDGIDGAVCFQSQIKAEKIKGANEKELFVTVIW
jgi:hypothetical protein